jgi:hypothetical protein
LTRWRESYNLLKAEEMSALLISFFKLPGSSPAIDLVFAHVFVELTSYMSAATFVCVFVQRINEAERHD